MISFCVLFFHKVHLELFQFFEADRILVSKMWDKAHQVFNFFNRNSQLALRNDIFVYICVDLNDFCLLLHACCIIVSIHGTFAESEEIIFFDAV